ncbi:MAG: hypothetical protein AAF903_13890, partial [Pseudomonadota bacterium]
SLWGVLNKITFRSGKKRHPPPQSQKRRANGAFRQMLCLLTLEYAAPNLNHNSLPFDQQNADLKRDL